MYLLASLANLLLFVYSAKSLIYLIQLSTRKEAASLNKIK